MKKSVCSLVIFLSSLPLLVALDASIAFATFKTYQQNYVEIYAQIASSTIRYKAIDSLSYQAQIEVLYLIKQNDKIVTFDKFVLETKPGKIAADLLDTKRFALPAGKYQLEATFKDLNKPGNEHIYRHKFEVKFTEDVFQLSDIQLLNKFIPDTTESIHHKVGYFLENNPTAFYHRNMHKLGFYIETYGSNVAIADDYMLAFGIERIEGNGSRTDLMNIAKKRSPKPYDAMVHGFDIKTLASGNYMLYVEARSRAKVLIARKELPFQRSNPFLFVQDTSSLDDASGSFVGNMPADTLRFCLKAIQAKTKGDENGMLNTVIASNDVKIQRNFLYRYWLNQNPANPVASFNQFMDVAKAVDNLYKTGFGYGFESDRGYIFLKYGKPDDVVTVEDDPVAPPYEIWVYYSFPVTKQSNVKFLFYNQSLAGNDYRILHSNARGELNNPRWQTILYKNAPNEIDGDNYNDATSMKDNFNRRASRYLEDF